MQIHQRDRDDPRPHPRLVVSHRVTWPEMVPQVVEVLVEAGVEVGVAVMAVAHIIIEETVIIVVLGTAIIFQ